MRNRIFFIGFVVILYFIGCGKESNVGPEYQNPVPEVGMYIFLPHGVETSPPHEVHLFCNVIDTSKSPVDYLTASRFVIKENGKSLDPGKSALVVRKRNTFEYRLNTVLLLDVSARINLELLKEAARAFVNNKDPRQSIAVYTFSSTLEKAQDFTQDSGQLLNAIEGITIGSAERNLYGAISRGFTFYTEAYSLGSVQQGQLVVFTAGNDTKNEKSREEILYTSQFANVYAIGLGSDLDVDFLNRVGNRGCRIVAHEEKLVEAFTKTQASIAKFADSFYWIFYQSSLRGGGPHEIELSISGNAYNGSGATMKGSIDASQFENLETGITLNWTPAKPEGVDTLIIGVNVPRTVKAFSQGGNAVPVYEWSSVDPEIMTVEPVAAGFPEAIVRAHTQGNTFLVVKDLVNGFVDTVFVQAVYSYDGFVLREWWTNMSGTSISSLTSDPRFPAFPTGREFIQQLNGPQSFGDNYGTRLRGFVRPDVSGTYSFWIASDDNSQLFLSMNDNPDQKKVIASVNEWTNYQEYGKYSSQHSANFELEAGKFYYIEVLHKEGSGGDNVSVAWQGPGIARTLIPSQNLSAWLGD